MMLLVFCAMNLQRRITSERVFAFGSNHSFELFSPSLTRRTCCRTFNSPVDGALSTVALLPCFPLLWDRIFSQTMQLIFVGSSRLRLFFFFGLTLHVVDVPFGNLPLGISGVGFDQATKHVLPLLRIRAGVE